MRTSTGYHHRAFAALLAAGVSAQAVCINEILYQPVPIPEDTRQEWIELHHPGTGTVSLAGWRLAGGIAFTFSNETLAAGGYLVVAADPAAFATHHPGVTNVTGGWIGRLANAGDAIELRDAADARVERIRYAAEGEWALRQRGPLDHGHRGWKWFAPHDGQALNTATDLLEGGASLERASVLLPGELGRNWQPSPAAGGSPGAANANASTNLPPLITEVTHQPAVPGPLDPVTVTARLVDEQAGGLGATLYWRNHTTTNPGGFAAAPMFDDGAHGDGLAGDGRFGVTLAAQSNGVVVEFYVRATDADAQVRTWPAPARREDGSFAQAANALFQVDDGLAPAAGANAAHPFLRVVVTGTEQQEFQNLMDNVNGLTSYRSDAEMNATFISRDGTGTRVRYQAGLRMRGEGSRSRTPPNWRVNFPGDDAWDGLTAINLNTQFIQAQLAGLALARQSGLPVVAGRAVQVRLNGVNHARSGAPINGSSTGSGFGSYALQEPIGSEWAARRFPDDGNGNVYRASVYPYYANLAYEGADLNAYTNATTGGYFKNSNTAAADWSDLLDLCWVLSTNTPDSSYVAAVTNRLNVDEWVRYFAVASLLEYSETSLAIGLGDDYALYRGLLDPRFQALLHDCDTVLGQGDGGMTATASVWAALSPSQTSDPTQRAVFLDRFLRHPAIAPRYYAELERLCETTFAADAFAATLDGALGGWVPEATLSAMTNFAATRRTSVRAQIPRLLTVGSALAASNGYPRTTGSNGTVFGTAPAAAARAVTVNGATSVWTAWVGRWTNTAALAPGLNALDVRAWDADGALVAATNLVVWRDTGAAAAGDGLITGATLWARSSGPYQVATGLTVAAGGELTIEPGTTIYLGTNATLTISGRLVAEGEPGRRIRFARPPGGGAAWRQLNFSTPGTNEQRLVHVDFAGGGNGGAANLKATGANLYLDDVVWSDTAAQLLDLTSSSITLLNSILPDIQSNELFHFYGMPANGHALIRGNRFGGTSGYNDIVDFTGGNRPGPIVRFYDNVFTRANDDGIDLDSTDAHIEGNLFLYVHQDAARDSASHAISTGVEPGDTNLSAVVIVRNLFFDVDHALLLKEGATAVFDHNTVVSVHTNAVSANLPAVINFGEPQRGTTGGGGATLDGNLCWDVADHALVVNFTNDPSALVVNRTLLPGTNWPGSGNLTNDPRLVGYAGRTITWTNLREALTLRAGSPARGSGANGLDRGGLVPAGASLSGEPPSPTPASNALLTVGGPGLTSYTWRVNGGPWSAQLPLAAPIVLSNLAAGAHTVEALGWNDAGDLQDTNAPTVSRTWIVDPAQPGLRLNEILAWNVATLQTNGESPDLVELYNAGGATADLGGMGLSDDPLNPYRYTFPAGTALEPGAHLLLIADNGLNPTNYLGFGLNQNGDALYLTAALTQGGSNLDAVVFGPQLADLSIGRQADGAWGLCRPTPAAANAAQPVGDVFNLRLNEWLAAGGALQPDDFIELYNGDPAPVALGGVGLTDEPVGAPGRHRIAPLSFIAGGGLLAFKADGNTNAGPTHLGFQLAAGQGALGLFAPDLTLIDQLLYGPQATGVSQGRVPNGGAAFAFFTTPTPGAGNPAGPPTVVVTNAVMHLLVELTNTVWRYRADAANLGTAWRSNGYDHAAWPTGRALFGVEPGAGVYPIPFLTPLPLTNGSTPIITYYFRAAFVAPTNLAGFDLNLGAYVDDGAVIYLNGAEILRLRVTNSVVAHTNLAQNQATEGAWETATFSADLLVPGATNVLAAEVHQSAATSSDLAWALQLAASRVDYATNTLTDRVQLNEVLADNVSFTNADGSVTDWVELYNASTNVFPLAGWSLTDDVTLPQRWIFPPGVALAPGAFLVVRCDGLAAASLTNGPVLHTGFGLDGDGDAVHLFDAAATLYDSIAFGPQAADFSLGHAPEGDAGWSLTLPTPGTANVAASPGSAAQVRINEWAASVAGGPDWLELHNPGAQPAPLGGLYLTDKLDDRTKHAIAPLSFIGVGTNAFTVFIADNDPAQGANHLAFSLAGAGEAIGLFPAGTAPALDSVVFGAQTTGVSEGRFPDGAAARAFFAEPSPGLANWLALTNVLINEVLSHTDPPLEDAIELVNAGGTAVDVGGWYLSDSLNALRKFRIPNGTIIPPGGFTVLHEYEFNPGPELAESFSFSSAQGDDAWLTQMDGAGQPTGFRARAAFGPSFNGVSFGRFRTSAGTDFTALTSLTFGVSVAATNPPGDLALFRSGPGATNSYAQVGPVVISELQYHPPDLGTNDNTRDEFIELHNLRGAAVPLYDPLHPTNGWALRGAVAFTFTAAHTLPATGTLVVVSFDPTADVTARTAFAAAYGTNFTLAGPFAGKLDNSGEAVELYAPDAPQTTPQDFGLVPYVLADRVAYLDRAPWPTNTDGTGKSLHRVRPAGYGNEPLNWAGGAPTPGRGQEPDTDGDGMPDTWEQEHGLNPGLNDAGGDLDNDGASNGAEYRAGTDPGGASSRLELDGLRPTNGVPLLQFLAAPLRSYSLFGSDTGAEPWERLLDVGPAPEARAVTLPDFDAAGVTHRWYRIATPAAP